MLSRQSILTTALLVSLVGLTNYLALKDVQSKLQSSPQGLHITGVGEKVQVTQMTPAGNLDYVTSVDQVIRYSDGKDRLFNIHAISYNKDHSPPWHLTAQNGWSYPNNTQLDLWDQVHIWKIGSKKNLKTISYPIDFSSPQLTYYPPQDFATTQGPVQFTEPGTQNITTGIGMRAHPKAGTLQLLSKVNSIYESPPTHSTSPKTSAISIISDHPKPSS